MPAKKKQKQIPPAVLFRYTLSGDFEAAAKMLQEDPSLIHAAAYGEDESALHFWAVENRPDIVSWLLERGANPDGIRHDSSPLSEAASLNNVEVCRVLIKAGAAVNARDYIEETPLHKAASGGYAEICLMLIEAGADVNATDGSETPWDQALPRKREQIRRLLEEHGGRSMIGEHELIELIEQIEDEPCGRPIEWACELLASLGRPEPLTTLKAMQRDGVIAFCRPDGSALARWETHALFRSEGRIAGGCCVVATARGSRRVGGSEEDP